MIIDRVYRDEIDDREWNRTGKDDYYLSMLIQLQFSRAKPGRAQIVSGCCEYFVNGYSRQEYFRNPYKEDYLRSNMVEISKIRPGFTKIDCEGEIIDIGAPRTVNLKTGSTGTVADAVLKDQSGTITLTLWDHNIKMVRKGSKVQVIGGFAKDFKGKLSLSTGKFGRMEVTQY